jgi:hypothetical protein
MGELLSGSVRREVAPFAGNSRLLDPFRKTVKTNRSPFIDRRPKAAMQDVDLPEPVILAPSPLLPILTVGAVLGSRHHYLTGMAKPERRFP